MTPGHVVRHRVWGEGRVVEVVRDGVLVHFSILARTQLVPFEQIGAVPPAAGAPMSLTKPPAAATKDVSARLALECLRQGQPPPMGLSDWTQGQSVARDQISKLIDKAATGQGGLAFVFGAFGGGKTHFGKLATELAASRGMASMWVEVDKNGTASLSSLGGILARAFASLRLPSVIPGAEGGARGLGPLLRAVSQRPIPRQGAVAVLRDLLVPGAPWIQEEEAVEVLEQYLSGGTKKAATAGLARFGAPWLPSLRMSSGMLSERRRNQGEQLIRICELVRSAGGHGMCLVIDEMDHDFRWDMGRGSFIDLSFTQRGQRSLESINELMRCASEAHMAVFLLSRSEVVVAGQAVRVELKELDASDFDVVVRKTVEAYRAAYPSWIVDGPSIAALQRHLQSLYSDAFRAEGWGPRFFVRATIEACELARSNGMPLGQAVGLIRVAA